MAGPPRSRKESKRHPEPPAGSRLPLAVVIRQEPKTSIYFLRRGTLYGAAVGMLLGLAAVAVEGYVEREAIVTWRNWILGGALVGLVVGAIRAVRMKTHRNEDRDV